MKSHPFNRLGKPAQRALANAGIESLKQLSEVTEKEFMQLHGVGKQALQIIKAEMLEKNLAFAPERVR
ncbi:hypothetical protein LX87_03898 [Larkinella arboricola]|uniref:RNA polymerase alpha subunit n=1 Tax=Larkinella arboricola TaxID=643671 RepID=A0A327WP74_LARAB|nr:hypothetical protein [Larkinella arboricola]RAJ94014.1 hypothetical protein LX87_03898 [Larkinella arboricola]